MAAGAVLDGRAAVAAVLEMQSAQRGYMGLEAMADPVAAEVAVVLMRQNMVPTMLKITAAVL